MQSPLFYILVALSLTSATISVIFLLVWEHLGRKRYALTWSLAFTTGSAQWISQLFAPAFPSSEIHLLTVNALSIVAIVLGLLGHCQRTAYPLKHRYIWLAALLVYAAVAWSIVVQPNVGLRVGLVPIAAAVALFLSTRVVLTHRRSPRPVEYATGIAMVIVGLIQLGGGCVALLQGAAGDEALRALFVHINFLTLPAGYSAVAMFVILMLASDISEQMKEVAVRDQLTNLLNRRGFIEHGSLAYASARRSGRKLSVIMTDVDRFKQVNDEFGHAAGDNALRHFAEVLRASRRAEDILARVGGEEFALVLPGTSVEDANRLATELCSRVEATRFLVNGRRVPLTASFGVATLSDKDTELGDMFLRADRALYRSKRDGRNRVDLESSQFFRTVNGRLEPATGGS